MTTAGHAWATAGSSLPAKGLPGLESGAKKLANKIQKRTDAKNAAVKAQRIKASNAAFDTYASNIAYSKKKAKESKAQGAQIASELKGPQKGAVTRLVRSINAYNENPESNVEAFHGLSQQFQNVSRMVGSPDAVDTAVRNHAEFYHMPSLVSKNHSISNG